MKLVYIISICIFYIYIYDISICPTNIEVAVQVTIHSHAKVAGRRRKFFGEKYFAAEMK